MNKIFLAAILIFLNSPAMAEILINIDKSKQQMTVVVDGVVTYDWPVSTGKRGYETPSGVYTTTSMNEIWYSKEWDNAPMPHAIFFMTDGHAIHGTKESKSLGKAVSHGCVRLSEANAATLYELVKEQGLDKTQVLLVGDAVYTEPYIERQRPASKQPQQRAKRWHPPAPKRTIPNDLYRGFYNG